MCEKAVKFCGELLESVPIELMTQEMCVVAFKQDKENLQFIPKEFQTYLLYE